MKIEIDEKRLKELEKSERMLLALQRGGVDDWEWYGDALSEFWVEELLEETTK
jgi:hypothetical protein